MPNPMTKQFPLRHKFAYAFSLQQQEVTPSDFGTILPLFMADQAKTEAIAQGIQVNPVNDNYESIVNTPACFMNSRVNKLKVTEFVSIDNAWDSPHAMYEQAVISLGLGDYQIKDPQGNLLITKLGIVQSGDLIRPSYNGTDILNGSFVSPDIDGLTTDQHLEIVAKRPSALRDERNGSLGGVVRGKLAGPGLVRLHKDFPRYRSAWYNNPKHIKRMNAFTGCFLYVGMNAPHTAAASAAENFMATTFDNENTNDEPTTNHHYLIEFNEWNDSFDIFG